MWTNSGKGIKWKISTDYKKSMATDLVCQESKELYTDHIVKQCML